MVIPLFEVTDPEQCINDQLQQFAGRESDSHSFVVTYPFRQYYLADEPTAILTAVVAFRKYGEKIALGATVTDRRDDIVERAATLEVGWENARTSAHGLALPWLELDAPILLEPIAIAKPWGQEIWFTGIERRGQSRVGDGSFQIPLPWLLSLAPQRLMGDERAEVVLLKILDPLPEPVYGDLYFEMHREKREIYIVTHVNTDAWPDGIGGIRMGFAQHKQHGVSETDFKNAYLSAVNNYRTIRRQIDDALDQCRHQAGIALDAPVSAQQTKEWLGELPDAWLKQEAQLRTEMEAFYALHPLAVGDVVKVPRRVPHSLQHGVRTIEFQTPVYERKILSFAQKVLTQAHWDTDEAMQDVELKTPPLCELELLTQDETHQRELIVSFEDFIVERIQLGSGAVLELNHNNVHRLVIGVVGETRVGEQLITGEQAMFIPSSHPHIVLHNVTAEPSTVLLAIPSSEKGQQ